MQRVEFDASDGGRVIANLYGSGEHAVVLAHGAVFDKESWHDQAEALAAAGLRVLAVDFRGYGDSRAGSEGNGAKHLDVLAAADYLRQSGAARVSAVGGSMGGGAVADAVLASKPGDFDRVVLLAAVPSAHPEKLHGKLLFIVSEGEGLLARTRDQHKAAPDPKKLVVLPGSAHAQHVFKTDQAERLLAEIRDWLTTS